MFSDNERFAWVTLLVNNEKRFEFLEHTADAYVAAHGKSLEEAFENAAVAMFEVMTKTNEIKTTIEDHVEVEAQDEQALLYSWLEALLVKFEIDGILFSKFKISNIIRASNGLELKAKIWGEKYDPSRHLQKVGVKAVTYHRMEIIKKPDKTTLKFILDI